MYRNHGDRRAPVGSKACLESAAFHGRPAFVESAAHDIAADGGEGRQSAPQPTHVIY